MKEAQQPGRTPPHRHRDAAAACPQQARAIVLVLVGLVGCVAGCQLPGTGAAPTPTLTPSPTATQSADWQALHRPLRLPTVTPGASCPAAQEHVVSSDFGAALGDGPVYPAAPWSHGTYSIDGAGNRQGWYELKVAWVSRPEYTGPILIRGQQIDGPNALRFGVNEQELLPELELPAGSGGSNPGGWGAWPSFTMPRVPGCYAYQVDGLSFSEVIVFQVVP
jgi:hypothetical protein